MTIEEPSLRHPQHLKYWLRCFKTLIPSHYTSADSSRLSLVYFTISALDILGYEFSQLDRSNSIAWIYSLQHPKGGFRSSPSIDLSPPYLCIGQIPSDERGRWDQPDLPGTFFALICLGILRDDFRRLERIHCLHWLRSLQRTDGSFGDFLGPDGQIAGGADSRFSYFAAAVRWILRPQPGHDIKARDLQRWVLDSEVCLK